VFSFTAMVTDSFGSFGTVSLSLSVSRPAPSFSVSQVVNAASFVAGAAPGSLFTIMGANLSTGTAAADRLPLPTVLGGTSVHVNGKAVPLLAVSPGQINAQLPFSWPDATAEITVVADGITSAKQTVPVARTAPGLFQVAADRLLAINENGTLNDASNRARAGSIVVLYATGCGALEFDLQEGAATPVDKLYRTRLPVTMTIGGKPAEVLFAGAAPGLSSGLVQVNVMVPELEAGEWPVVLVVGGAASNAPKLYASAR
jgi:uncharacterized protein (TIGR03437 family)